MFCDICQEIVLGDEIVTACRHIFHEPCLSRWLRSHLNCPTCNYAIAGDDVTQCIKICLKDSRAILLLLPETDVTIVVTKQYNEETA